MVVITKQNNFLEKQRWILRNEKFHTAEEL